jgi:hypothetical protein
MENARNIEVGAALNIGPEIICHYTSSEYMRPFF